MRDLDARRAERWWQVGRPIRSITRTGAFIDDVGFAMLFPKAGISMPTLWQAASDRPFSDTDEWGPDIERVWGWKDRLPLEGRAWYGRFVRGQPSFLSPALLADLYEREGVPDDFEAAGLGADAHRIASVLLRSGPLPSVVLREACGMAGKSGSGAFSRALTELGRKLVVTNYGTEQEGSGWPSAVLELTARVFRVPVERGRSEARRRSARRFLHTMLAVRAYELGNAFGWRASGARAALNELVSNGEATLEANIYRPMG